MQAPKISVVFKTIFQPTGAFYLGVHDTEDLSFGTQEFKDGFIGNGTKLIALAKQSGNRRSLFNVQALKVSTRKECDEYLKRLLDNLDYSNPLILNAREGWPVGRRPTQTHLENKAAALSVALKRNENATGRRDANIDIDFNGPQGSKLKWFHSPDLSNQKMIVCDGNDKPIKSEYSDWILGKLNKNLYVQQRIDSIKKEENDEDTVSNQ